MLIAEQGPYMLMVRPDDIAISPREVDEHFGTMVCFHPRYALGDSHNYMDKDDFLREMYLDTVGHDEQGMKRYERMVNIVGGRYMRGPKTEEQAVDDAMLNVISGKYIMMPLYLTEHSGLAMHTECPRYPGGRVPDGWIYVSREDALKRSGAEKMTGAIKHEAEELMRDEVEVYDAYLRGESYGYELYKNGGLLESCWGFNGRLEDACRDMAEHLPEECRGMVERLEEQEQPAAIIKTLLRHAKIQIDQAAKVSGQEPRRQKIDTAR